MDEGSEQGCFDLPENQCPIRDKECQHQCSLDISETYMNSCMTYTYFNVCHFEALKCIPEVDRKVIRTSGSSIILGKQDYVEGRSTQKNGVRHTCLFPDPFPLVRNCFASELPQPGSQNDVACFLIRVFFETGNTKQVRKCSTFSHLQSLGWI